MGQNLKAKMHGGAMIAVNKCVNHVKAQKGEKLLIILKGGITKSKEMK